MKVTERIAIADDEFRWEFARSGGPGGQNVNKVESKATLRWCPGRSPSLTAPVRDRLVAQVANRLTAEGDLLITSQRTRDQSRNVADCLEKLRQLVLAAAVPPKPRRPSRPTLASRRRRLEAKLQRSQTKRLRRRPEAE